MIRGARFLVPVLGVLLVATACGSSAKKSDPAADLTVAKGAVLTKADLPAGYDSTPYDSKDDVPAAEKLKLANCLGAKVSLFDDTPGEQKAHSDDFSLENKSVSNEVDVYAKKSQAEPGYKALTNKKAPECLATFFKDAVTAGSPSDSGSAPPTVGNITVTALPISSGDRAIGYRATIPLTTSNGQKGTVYTDLLAAQKGRATVNVIAQDINAPYDSATEVALMNKVIDRIGNQAK